jgi:hemerythrin
MALYQWDACLECGHELIDKQHKQLVSMLNEMWEAYHAGGGAEKLEQSLDFLTGYTVKHFADEEKLQIAYKYPDYYRHRQIHTEFKQTVADLREKLSREGISDALVDEVCVAMGKWFVTHIQGEDFSLAEYIKLSDQSG